jgi:predicted acyl esterase
VLCLTTEPLEEDLVVTGPLVATLYVSTDGLDTDFTVKLLDIYPPGPTTRTAAGVLGVDRRK